MLDLDAPPKPPEDWDGVELGEAVRSFGQSTLVREHHKELTNRVAYFISEFSADVTRLDKRFSQLDERCKRLQSEKDRLRDDLSTLKVQVIELREELGKQSKRGDQHQDQIKTVREALAERRRPLFGIGRSK